MVNGGRKSFFRNLALLMLSGLFFCAFAFADPLVRGNPLPDLSASPLLEAGQYADLGLAAKEGPVRLLDIKSEMLVVELFNRFCFSCLRQAEELQNYYTALKETGLFGRVRVLAVGIGNSAEDLRNFKSLVATSYPSSPDQAFEFYYGLGDLESAPVTLFLKKTGDKWLVADALMGVHGAVEMLAATRVILDNMQGKMPALDLSAKAKRTVITDAEKVEFARAAFEKAGLKDASPRLIEAGGMDVYEAADKEGKPLGLYAVVARRRPVCDLCHESVFAFALDGQGVIKAFLPIYLTKFGNEVWSGADEKFMEGKLLGRPATALVFKSDVDAVTSATMSSSLVFDEARRAGEIISAKAKK